MHTLRALAVMKYQTKSQEDTLRLAGCLARSLKSGDCVLLHGDLGAGKSVFARGIARALGVRGAMPSPSFTLLIPYQGCMKVYHYDLYRLNDPEEFYAAGLDEFIGAEGVAIIEWPEMGEIAPEPAVDVVLSRLPDGDENVRGIEIEARGVQLNAEALEEWRVRE